MSESLVIIPTYNEIENIERIIRAVFSLAHRFDILIVDDGSPDGTDEAVEQLMGEYPGRLHLERRKGKLGLGTAYIHGFRWRALDREYIYIFEMDADFSHNPQDLLRLRQACEEGADMAIGSRYINGVNVVNWPMKRVLMSYMASMYVRFIMRIDIRDATAGFVCFKRQVLEAIGLEKVRFVGYAFQIEMKFKALELGFRVVEVPIIFTDRTHGISKMSTKIFREAFWGVIQLKWQSLFNKKYRKK